MAKQKDKKHNPKNAGVALSGSDKVDFRAKSITKDRGCSYNKGSIHQEDITILNFMHHKVVLEDCADDTGTINKWGSEQVLHLTVEIEKITDDGTIGIQRELNGWSPGMYFPKRPFLG